MILNKRRPLRITPVVVIILMFGCQEKPKFEQQAFVPKPEIPLSPVRSWDELATLVQERDDVRAEEWNAILSAGPACLRELYVNVEPLPGTAWYEYLRSNQDFSSQLDAAVLADCIRFDEQVQVEDVSSALRELVAGTADFEAGLLANARDHFRKAVWWMEEATDVELEKKAIAGRGDIKIYKGDAYERTMVHFYLGIIAYQLGEYQEARRELHRALMADMSKPAQENRGKLALIHYWLGKTYARLGDLGNARVAVEKAKAINPDAPALPLLDLERMENENMTVLVQLGAGGSRVPIGADWQKTEYRRTPYTERSCELFIDGQHIGTPVLLADLWQQATTQGQSEEEKLAESKQATKSVIQSLPYINILGVAWDVTGDLRSWALLPDRLFIWSGRLPSGDHTVTIKFYDEQDYELIRYRQTWFYVPAFEDRDTVLVVRSARDKCALRRTSEDIK